MKGQPETLHTGRGLGGEHPVGTAIAERWCSCVWLFSGALTQPYTYKHMCIPPSRGLSGTFYLLPKWVPSTNPPIRPPFMFYRLINLTGFTCSRIWCRPVRVCAHLWPCVHACLPWCVCVWGLRDRVREWVWMRARTLLQRLHGGGGLQWDQALSLEVENVLLLKLLHLDQLLLEGQLLTA